jgi:hypothetical protein
MIKVSRISVNGKHYLKTSENVLYDPITKFEVAIWDPETRTVIDLEDDEDEDEDEDDEFYLERRQDYLDKKAQEKEAKKADKAA